MSRVKTTLKAPLGVTEACIEGTYYWPDENGDVDTTNATHAKILTQHGFAKTAEVSIMAPAAAKGPIDVDELGRAQLQSALSERGLAYPDTASRAELAEIAAGWNAARRRGFQAPAGSRVAAEVVAREPIFETAAAARAAEPRLAAEDAAAGGGAPETVEKIEADPDFGDASYDELKGWLAAHGVAFPPNTPKKTLREMAETEFTAIKARKAAAA